MLFCKIYRFEALHINEIKNSKKGKKYIFTMICMQNVIYVKNLYTHNYNISNTNLKNIFRVSRLSNLFKDTYTLKKLQKSIICVCKFIYGL